MTPTSAVVLMHLQNDVIDPAGTVGRHGNAAEVARRDVLARTAALLAAARSAAVPVAHVGAAYTPATAGGARNVPLFAHHEHDGRRFIGSWAADFHPAVAPVAGDIVHHHFGVIAFEGTTLSRDLTQRGVNHLYLAGVSTHIAVLATTFAATDRGYYVSVVDDCCAAATPELHDTALQTLRLFAEITTSDAAVAAIGPQA
jgi:nicotinamidase-related amidase